MFKKNSAALLSLSAATALLISLAGTASAAPAPVGESAGAGQIRLASANRAAALQSWPIIDWDITDITSGRGEHANRYWNLIDAIHRNTYGDATDAGSALVQQTTRNTNRLIQIRVMNEGAHLVSVYMWADNLYIAGFYSPAANRHWAFQDGRQEQFQTDLGITARLMPRTGNYNGINGGSTRENLYLGATNIFDALYGLHNVGQWNETTIDRGMLMAITIFSEAARFGPIFNRIYGNINGFTNYQLSVDYRDMENQWGRLSQAAHAWRQGRSASVRLIGNNVTSFDQLRRVVGFVELHGSEALL
ncbi:ribosome-inactivating family protein [Kitasatospora sp. CM 4170]|uniref:Ribosome-inactivating family protein n=1 Tax=Kitasatospora aburaviensis TaxID=67265 RepID=A0ABW1F1R7_9ACTN|nr:ribosome-inactivating family protein [Kitasatospora sp. CM 4170]WNM49297.1 ribosome-inactivating family protein [Kitasatospora sp. CM 4170]